MFALGPGPAACSAAQAGKREGSATVNVTSAPCGVSALSSPQTASDVSALTDGVVVAGDPGSDGARPDGTGGRGGAEPRLESNAAKVWRDDTFRMLRNVGEPERVNLLPQMG
jgi:hypothetical protein